MRFTSDIEQQVRIIDLAEKLADRGGARVRIRMRDGTLHDGSCQEPRMRFAPNDIGAMGVDAGIELDDGRLILVDLLDVERVEERSQVTSASA